jgi:hypothetical protein
MHDLRVGTNVLTLIPSFVKICSVILELLHVHAFINGDDVITAAKGITTAKSVRKATVVSGGIVTV